MHGILKILYYALLLVEIGGVLVFLRQLKRQIYSTATEIGLERVLNSRYVQVPGRIEYSLRPGTKQDVDELIEKAKTESKESTHRLLYRKWCYDCGLRNFYVARTTDTDDLCYIQWMICAEDNDVLEQKFKGWFPKLQQGHCLLENAYTFERYRGKKIMASVMARLCEIAKSKGFKRVITYVLKDNISALKGCEQACFKAFEEVPEMKLLFRNIKKYGNEWRNERPSVNAK